MTTKNSPLTVIFELPGRCPRHRSVKTSSDDGLFDAPCHICEAEMNDAYKAACYVEDAATTYGLGLVSEEDAVWLRGRVGRTAYPLSLAEAAADIDYDRETPF